jgi:hypothetical protein
MANLASVLRFPRLPWRPNDARVQLQQNYVLHPKVPLHITLQKKHLADERRALSRYQRRTILGPLFEDNHPVLTDGSFSSFLAAFNKRCNYSSNARVDPYIIKSSARLLNQICPKDLPVLEWTKDLFDEWVVQFPPSKRNRLIKAIEKISHFTQNEFSTKDVFEKVELLMKRHDPAWAGRIVNASSDLHNALSGPILSACLKRMVAAADANASTNPKISFRVAYGATPQQFVEHMDGPGPFIQADFSSNDKLQVEDVGNIEYKWAIRFGMPQWLARVILAANHYVAQSRKFGVRARLKYQLPSGSTSTTWRNSIWNSTIFYAWARRFSVHCVANILGDDMIARVLNGRIPRRARRQYEHFAKLAQMKAKVAVFDALVDCDFLSRRFMPTCHGYLVIPRLGKALGRFNARGNARDIADHLYVAGKSLSYAYEFRHYKPIMAKFMERFLLTGAPFHGLDERLLSYSLRQAIDYAGSRSALLSQLSSCPSANDDEFCQYSHYIYGKTRMDVMDDVDCMLFGDSDLSLARSAAYLAADVW